MQRRLRRQPARLCENRPAVRATAAFPVVVSGNRRDPRAVFFRSPSPNLAPPWALPLNQLTVVPAHRRLSWRTPTGLSREVSLHNSPLPVLNASVAHFQQRARRSAKPGRKGAPLLWEAGAAMRLGCQQAAVRRRTSHYRWLYLAAALEDKLLRRCRLRPWF